MCQTLGWHRLPAMQDETTDKKAGIFWFSYMLDKGLSLRFGRSSVIQDYDISMPRRVGRINVTDPWRTLLNLWIEHAELMGRSYEELYSPGAMARGPDQRLESARLLIDSIKGMIHQTDELALTVKKEHEASGPKDLDAKSWRDMTLECILKADQVSYWSSLTLIYRAIPIQAGMPSRFNTECIEAARLAFECHQECIELTSGNPFMMAGYLHWYEEIAFLSCCCCERTLNPGVVGCALLTARNRTVLYSPFIPFIVLFCHVIETSDSEDLERLGLFVTTLQPVLSMSEAIEKLHRLCQVLYKVAALYAEAKAQQEEDQDMNMVGNDFDVYLSQLGFITPQQPLDGPGGGGSFGNSELPAASQASQLNDWFSGNRRIMGLMEEDLSGFNPGVWSSIVGP